MICFLFNLNHEVFNSQDLTVNMYNKNLPNYFKGTNYRGKEFSRKKTKFCESRKI